MIAPGTNFASSISLIAFEAAFGGIATIKYANYGKICKMISIDDDIKGYVEQFSQLLFLFCLIEELRRGSVMMRRWERAGIWGISSFVCGVAEVTISTAYKGVGYMLPI